MWDRSRKRHKSEEGVIVQVGARRDASRNARAPSIREKTPSRGDQASRDNDLHAAPGRPASGESLAVCAPAFWPGRSQSLCRPDDGPRAEAVSNPLFGEEAVSAELIAATASLATGSRLFGRSTIALRTARRRPAHAAGSRQRAAGLTVAATAPSIRGKPAAPSGAPRSTPPSVAADREDWESTFRFRRRRLRALLTAAAQCATVRQ